MGCVADSVQSVALRHLWYTDHCSGRWHLTLCDYKTAPKMTSHLQQGKDGYLLFAWKVLHGTCFQIYGKEFLFTTMLPWKSERTFRRVSLGAGQKGISSGGCPTFLGRISELHLFNPHCRSCRD